MNEILKLKSYHLLKIVVDAGFWIAVTFCIGMTIFLFTNLFGGTNNVFTLNISSGSGFVINNNVQSNFGLPLWTTIISFIIVSVVGIFILWSFRSIVRSIGNGTPFIFQNVRRMRFAACLLFAQSYGLMIVGYFAAQYHRLAFEQLGIQPILIERLEILPNGAVLALCVLVLAEIFRYGCILQGAYDTTV